MTKEVVSKAEAERAKSILQSEHGVVFFPKRQLAIPIFQKEHVSTIVGEKNADTAIGALNGIVGYLKGAPIGDSFGSEHGRRRDWRTAMIKQYGTAFKLIYEEPNQFRVNNMLDAISGIMLLQRCVRENRKLEVGEELDRIDHDWRERMNGIDPKTGKQISKKYNDLESYEERLEVVRFCEDNFLDALRLFTIS